jgi:hypothetical protein
MLLICHALVVLNPVKQETSPAKPSSHVLA